MAKFPGSTIRLSDTADQFSRKVHVNVRNDKVTLVYRWKSIHDTRAHTQRITLTEDQASRLLGSVAMAATVALQKSGNEEAFAQTLKKHCDTLEEAIK